MLNKYPRTGASQIWARRGFAMLCAVLIASLWAVPAVAQEPAASETPAAALPYQVIDRVVTPSSIQETRRFFPVADSYISSGFPTSNFGSTASLFLGWNGPNVDAARVLVRWDLSSIPSNANISSTFIGFFQTTISPPGDGNMDFRAQHLTSSWNETGVTWNNANFLGGSSLPIGTIPGVTGWVGGPANDLVRSWVNGSVTNHGLMFTGDETSSRNRSRIFNSRETGASSPYLDVTWDVSCDNVPPTANVQPLPQYSPLSFRVFWTGFDSAPVNCQPSGVANYDVQYRVNGGNWVDWKVRTTSTNNEWAHAENGQFVEFRARATDNAGNRSTYPASPQASTVLDGIAPVSNMTPLPDVTVNTTFVVSWSGSDNLSGIATYDVQYSTIDTDVWTDLVIGTTSTSYQVTGAQEGQTYQFRVRATDKAGNAEPYPENAETQTLILNHPVSAMNPINPAIVGPATPAPTSFNVTWSVFVAPGTTLQSTTIFYRLNGGAWVQWQTFPGTQFFATFPFAGLGLGDGMYEFFSEARNTAGQVEPRANTPEAFVIVDLAGKYQVAAYMPLIKSQ
jgi:hypothetical protein